MQQDQLGHGRLQDPVLRPRIPDHGEGRRGEMQLPVHLVLQGGVREMPSETRGALLQLKKLLPDPETREGETGRLLDGSWFLDAKRKCTNSFVEEWRLLCP